MPRRVTLINPPSDCVDDNRLEPPLGLMYIAGMLEQHGIPVSIYDMTGSGTREEIDSAIAQIPESALFGITTYCTNYSFVKRCISEIRSRPDKSWIVLGGPNASALPDYTLKDSGCDQVLVGEGDDAFVQIALAGELEALPRVVFGVPRQDLDSLPVPARHLVDLTSYSRTLNGHPVISLLSSRGCKHACAHCNSVVMGGGGKVRYRSATGVAAEMKELQDMGFSHFRFNDDCFTSNPNLAGLTDAIRKLGVQYRVFGRIEEFTEENCRLLSRSGCLHVSVGIESLDDRNRRIIGKRCRSSVIEKALQHLGESGMTVRTFFLVGLPFDTQESVEESFARAAGLPFDEFSIYPLIPYPGTRIAREPDRYGYEILDKDFTRYVQIGKNRSTACVLRHKNFTERDVARWLNLASGVLTGAGKIPQNQSPIAN